MATLGDARCFTLTDFRHTRARRCSAWAIEPRWFVLARRAIGTRAGSDRRCGDRIHRVRRRADRPGVARTPRRAPRAARGTSPGGRRDRAVLGWDGFIRVA